MLPNSTQAGPDNGPGWELLTREAHSRLDAHDHDDASAGASHVPTTSSHAALDSVHCGNNNAERVLHLPLEIIEIIVLFACGIQPRLTSAACIDAKTTLRIALASKALHGYALPLLYTCITLTRPSQLMLYARIIVRRPKLAKLAKTLWIGPDSETLLSPFWWPLNADRSAMRSSVTDPEKLPREVARGQWWSATASHEGGQPSNVGMTAEAAVAELIRGAWQRLDAAMDGPESCNTCLALRDERHCPHDGEWRIRAFKVQCLLDEYLQDWRKHQDAALDRQPELDHKEPPDGVWPDPYYWLMSNCDKEPKPGRGPCDLYDHPTLYERSEIGCFSTGAEGEGFSFGSESWWRPLGHHRLWTLDVLDNLRSQSTPSGMLRLTTSDLLEAAATILLRLTRLTGLALTAYTRAALASTLDVVPRSALRLLSLGPMPQRTSEYLPLKDVYFPNLEILHFQSDFTYSLEVSGTGTLGDKLEAIRWNFWTPHYWSPDGFGLGLSLPISGLKRLLTPPREAAGGSEAQQRPRIVVSADDNNIVAFYKEHYALRSDPHLEIRRTEEGMDRNDWTYDSPAFLGREAYHFRAFNLMQKQWKEDVEKVLRDDT